MNTQVDIARTDSDLYTHFCDRLALGGARLTAYADIGRRLRVRRLALPTDAALRGFADELVCQRRLFLRAIQTETGIVVSRCRQFELGADDDQEKVAAIAIR
jgi:hypothetical protein